MTRHETEISSNLLRERFASDHLVPLSGRGWLASIDPETATRILSIGRLRKAREGDRFFYTGDGDGGLFGVISGGVLAWVPGAEATMVPAHVMRAGSWFGTGPLRTRRRGMLTAQAAEDSVCLHLPLPGLKALISADPAVADAVARLSALTTDTCLECASDLMIRSSEQRIAAVLLRVTTTAAGDVSPDDPRGFLLSHSLIAHLCNASRDTVSRTLAKFRERGWIDGGYRRLAIRDVEAMRKAAKGLPRRCNADNDDVSGRAVSDQVNANVPAGRVANRSYGAARSRLRIGLNAHVWFARQSPRLQDALLSSARIVTLERDEEVLERVETEQRLVGVLSGSALVSIEGLDGAMHPLHVIRAGIWLANRPDPAQIHRGFIAKTLEPSRFVTIRMSDLAPEVRGDLGLAKDIASILDYSQDLLIACAVDLLVRETDRRVAAVLLRLAGMDGLEAGLAKPRTIALPQRLIGQIANASRDSVNRVLAGFAARAWITVDYGRIEITDPERLRVFANGG